MATKPQRQLEALHVLARALATGEFRARTVLGRACTAVADAFAFERVGIVRYVPASGVLIPFVAHGLSADEQAALPAALPIRHFGAFGRALATGSTTYVADPSGERSVPTRVAREFGIGSFVIVPLLSEGRALGFMTCDQRGDSFSITDEEVDLLTTFGALIAAFFDRAIQHGELRRLNELKSQFVALASHELRTPAAAIYGAVRTLDAREEELPPEQRGELRRMLSRQADKLNELVQNLLDLSRLEAEAIRVEPTELNLRAKVEEIAGSVLGSEQTVELDVADDLRAVVDPQAFERIVGNLLANAARHGAPPIRVAVDRTDHELSLLIEDHGPGISPDIATSIFDRFTRGTTAATEQGAGLGLAIAQSYARAHGGAIIHEPALPHGARFRVTLPVS